MDEILKSDWRQASDIPRQNIVELKQNVAIIPCRLCALRCHQMRHILPKICNDMTPSHSLYMVKTSNCHSTAVLEDSLPDHFSRTRFSWRPTNSAFHTIQNRALKNYEAQRRGAEVNPNTESTCSTNELIAFKTVASWLKDCISHHAVCSRMLRRNFSLPTRLIDLGPDRLCQPRICVGANLPVGTRYMTLSHCWGDLAFMRLTSSNMEAFQNRIPVNFLMKTFRDAMEITKRLDVRYLWIDSFCIIQGKLANAIHGK